MLSSSSDNSCQQLFYRQLSASHPTALAASDVKQFIRSRNIMPVNSFAKMTYLAFPSACCYINSINLILFKLGIVYSCFWIRYTQHNLIPVHDKLLHLVAKNTFNNFTIISSSNLLNCFSYILVLSGKKKLALKEYFKH